MVGDAGIELMAIAAWHPFKTRRRVAETQINVSGLAVA